MKLVTSAFDAYILSLSLAILVALFAVQSRGTAAVAAWFGPIMVVWFVVLALGGLSRLTKDLSILGAISPTMVYTFS